MLFTQDNKNTVTNMKNTVLRKEYERKNRTYVYTEIIKVQTT